MKKLIFLSTFFFSVSVHALPDCPSDTPLRLDNCFGVTPFTTGGGYVGEFKDNKFHGQGTATFANGDEYVGYFMDGQYIPFICQEMGLVKGTDSFGNCVLKLIDDL